MNNTPVIAFTPGEPAGVGPDLCLFLARNPPPVRVVIIADAEILKYRAGMLGMPLTVPVWAGRRATRARLSLLPVAAPAAATVGRPDPANAPYIIETLDRAIEGCRNGEFDALVTGPVHKGVLNDAGIAFTGHTEFLAQRCHCRQPVMMLACPGLRVALATTHVPLADVSRHLTRERLTEVLQVLHHDLRARFRLADPQILVCGLNPHAGESGYLGREETEIIGPVVAELRARGMTLRGPVPADTAFTPARLAATDAVLAMYHDQGLPVVKHHDFKHAVNITLGLPFIRTSVDHGTALELAGTGEADPSSLYAAIELAIELTKNKNRQDSQDFATGLKT